MLALEVLKIDDLGALELAHINRASNGDENTLPLMHFLFCELQQPVASMFPVLAFNAKRLY